MRANFKFRSGKFEGKTYQWVSDNNPQYLRWVKENQPKMLVDRETPKKEVKVTDIKEDGNSFKITPNMNFENEPPEEYCIPYMLDNSELYQEQLDLFKKHYKTRFRLIKEEYESNRINTINN